MPRCTARGSAVRLSTKQLRSLKPSPFAVAFGKGALQVPRLPRISCQGWWRRELHAVFLTENRTRCSLSSAANRKSGYARDDKRVDLFLPLQL